MLRRIATVCAATIALLGAAPKAGPSPTPGPDPEADHIFALAKQYWRDRTDVRYVRFGALVRYLHDGHVFDNWWDEYYRTSDGKLALQRVVDVDEEHRRLKGVPFSIFGLKIFDTNKDAEPIRLDEPRILPDSSFGIVTRDFAPAPATPTDGPTLQPFAFPTVAPDPSGSPIREITRVEATSRDYRVTRAPDETLAGQPAIHLHLEPLRQPDVNRLRDVWLDPTTYRTLQLNVQGIFNGKPYDGVLWTIRYVLVDGRQYVQQIVADEPLRFGIDTTLPKFEFDFVDFRFPSEVPRFTFDRPF